ncbi:MAG: hypothetical protein RJA70_782 [Pseudomonadota bacterium]|jgi:hypothetical protein
MSTLETSGNGDFVSVQEWLVKQLQRDRFLPKQADATEGSELHLTGNDRLRPVDQLEIYRVQFWLRHTSAMLDDYPGVSGILGQAEWEQLVESYLLACSPTSYSLRDLGDRFAAHIASRPVTPHQDLCEDMARLEWAYTELFDAAPAPPLDAAKLAALPEEAWQTARIVFNPAFQLLSVRYPVAELRRQLRNAQSHPDTEPSTVAIPEPEAQHLVLYRDRQLRLMHRRVGAPAALLLRHLRAGQALVPAAEATAAELPEAAAEVEAQVGAWFQDWGACGWIVDVQAGD